MKDFEKSALDLLRKYEDWVEPNNRFVFWSGGKDSTVALHLSLQAWGNPQVVFIDTGITLPETLEYVQCMEKEWDLDLTVLKTQIDFWKYVKKYGFPAVPYYLWCRRLLKMKPTKEFMKRNRGWKVQVLGIRKKESVARMNMDLYDRPFRRNYTLPYTYNLLPILEWDENDKTQYIEKYEIPINPCYNHYGVSGCYFCPFIRNPKYYMKLRYRHPNFFRNIVEAEKAIKRPSWKAFKTRTAQNLSRQKFLEVSK